MRHANKKGFMNNEYVYLVRGKTAKGINVFASIGTLEFVLNKFIIKYPRFKGTANIYKVKAHRFENIVMTNCDEEILTDSFDSTSTLKTLFDAFLGMEIIRSKQIL
jgi:hypothetical protein